MSHEGASSGRLVIIDSVARGREDEFANAVREGLTASPKHLAPKFFYDELGSHLFEAICLLPEYYLTRAESEILSRFAGEIVGRFHGAVSLVELGSGSAVKSRYLIRALLDRQARLHYQPIDISPTMLGESAAALLTEFAGLQITAIAADYTELLSLSSRSAGERRLALFLGSNVGNYDPAEARVLIARLRSALEPGDAFLIGADLRKSAAILEAAYDDSLGVTASFNLNVLQRINRELGGEFDLRLFAHRSRFNEMAGRIEMHLVSRTAQTVRIPPLNLTLDFAAGETIHTENSYKYELDDLSVLAAETGFRVAQSWFDGARQFSCSLWFAV